jgi:sulfur-oxidizing protein SoxY
MSMDERIVGDGIMGRNANASAPSRRSLLAGGLSLALIPVSTDPAAATPEGMAEAMREALGGSPEIRPGRVRLEIPELAENGNSVPLKVSVDSPMTAADHVAMIYVFSEKNPSPNVVRFHLGSRCGRARVQTSIRLASTQRITAVAKMSDGALWSATANVVVTAGACIDDT